MSNDEDKRFQTKAKTAFYCVLLTILVIVAFSYYPVIKQHLQISPVTTKAEVDLKPTLLPKFTSDFLIDCNEKKTVILNFLTETVFETSENVKVQVLANDMGFQIYDESDLLVASFIGKSCYLVQITPLEEQPLDEPVIVPEEELSSSV